MQIFRDFASSRQNGLIVGDFAPLYAVAGAGQAELLSQAV